MSSNNVTSNILLKELDSFKGFLVHLDGAHKELVRVTLVIFKSFNLTLNFVSSKIVPSDVVLGIGKFLFKSNLIILGLNEELLVHFHDFGEFGNGCSTNLFISVILGIRSLLSINVGLFKVVQEIEDSVNSIISLGTCLEESKDLVLNTSLSSEGNSSKNKNKNC